MSHSRAKRIRQAIVPERSETGMSRGEFVRMLTQYDAKIHKVVRFEKAFNGEDFDVPYHTITVKPDCPRGMIRKFSKVAKHAHKTRPQLQRA